MRCSHLMPIILVVSVISLPGLCIAADANRPTERSVNPETISKTPSVTASTSFTASFVKTVDFYLRSGELVSGKLVSEDKNKIIIERIDGSKIIVDSYTRRDIDSRTMGIKSIPEYRYYMDMGKYFSGKTWDFEDDPDDFIESIRCYEKAKQLLLDAGSKDDEVISQISLILEQLRQDRQIWEKEVESRARLKKLEFDAQIEKKVDEFEKMLKENKREIESSLKQFNEIIDSFEKDYQKNQNNIYEIERNLSNRLDKLADRVAYMADWYGYNGYSSRTYIIRHQQPDSNK